MAASTITRGFSISGGMQVAISKTITLGYGIGQITAPLRFLTLDGTWTRELLLSGKINLKLSLLGTRTDKMEF